MASTEIWLAAGGDFVQTDNGDLLLAYDTPQAATATAQRMARLLTTNPRLTASDGSPLSTPGDIFNPDYGAGEPAEVGQPITTAFVAALRARILNGLLSDTTIKPIPSPTVTVTQVDNATVQVSIDGETVDGSPVAMRLPYSPSQPS